MNHDATHCADYSESRMRVHNLKCESVHFRDVWEGRKKAEIRRDDRGFEIGDGIMLWETKSGEKTGSRIMLIITHILRNVPEYGLRDGFCIISFEHLGLSSDISETVSALRMCAEGAPCSDCPQRPKKWNCDWNLMGKAADLIEHLAIVANNYKKALEALERSRDGQ